MPYVNIESILLALRQSGREDCATGQYRRDKCLLPQAIIGDGENVSSGVMDKSL
ncbi:hypothetical protein [Synechocystis sp. LKSZ1]|uniref:hypothetical protein n=1 Tax=Synechocystis sp. LKSZ1 TaxID=3144951 RepID=UPI00336BC9D9